MKNLITKLLISLLTLTAVTSLSFASSLPLQDDENDQVDCTVLTYNLKVGSRDSNTNGEVSKLQTFLGQTNYLDADPTGYYGNATKRAVKNLQKDNSVTQTGTVGAYTRLTIKNISCGIVTTPTNPVTVTDPVIPGMLNVTYYRYDRDNNKCITSYFVGNSGEHVSNGQFVYLTNEYRTLEACNAQISAQTTSSLDNQLTFYLISDGKPLMARQNYNACWRAGKNIANEQIFFSLVPVAKGNSYDLPGSTYTQSATQCFEFTVPGGISGAHRLQAKTAYTSNGAYAYMSEVFTINNTQLSPTVTGTGFDSVLGLVFFGSGFNNGSGYVVKYKYDCSLGSLQCNGVLNSPTVSDSKLSFALNFGFLNTVFGNLSVVLQDANGNNLSQTYTLSSPNTFSLPIRKPKINQLSIDTNNTMNTLSVYGENLNSTTIVCTEVLVDGTRCYRDFSSRSDNMISVRLPQTSGNIKYNVWVEDEKNNLKSNTMQINFNSGNSQPSVDLNLSNRSTTGDTVNLSYNYSISNNRNGVVLDVEPYITCGNPSSDCSKYVLDINDSMIRYDSVLADPYVPGGASYRFYQTNAIINISGHPSRLYNGPVNLTPYASYLKFKFVLRDTLNGGADLWSKVVDVDMTKG